MTNNLQYKTLVVDIKEIGKLYQCYKREKCVCSFNRIKENLSRWLEPSSNLYEFGTGHKSELTTTGGDVISVQFSILDVEQLLEDLKEDYGDIQTIHSRNNTEITEETIGDYRVLISTLQELLSYELKKEFIGYNDIVFIKYTKY